MEASLFSKKNFILYKKVILYHDAFRKSIKYGTIIQFVYINGLVILKISV